MNMSTLQEIEKAVASLAEEECDRFRKWLNAAVRAATILWAWAAAGWCQAPPELPRVIPHPQMIQKTGQRQFVLGEDGWVLSKTVERGKGGLLDEAANLIERTLHERGLTKGSRPPATTILLTTQADLAAGAAPALTPQESAALARSDQAYVIRMLPEGRPTVWIIGSSPLGAFYGAATLVQLVTPAGPGALALPQVEVQDYPDIPGRMCADWVLTWDWEINAYDWGDGLDAFLARCKRKIDLCARYKVNLVRFLGGRISPGPPYMKERYERIQRFALPLNRYARRKGVALQFSSSSWGVDYYGWGAVYAPPWILNRESYPDGPVYSCVTGTTGGCLSNDALLGLIARRQKQLVQDIEPGSIYLHQIDVAT